MAEKEGLLPFKLIEDESGEALTSYGGLPLVMETCEALGLAGLVKHYVRIKQRNRGYTESKYVESVIALMAAGGDCLEDIERLRSDAGLKLLLGEMPSAEAVRFFLYGFHDEKLLESRPEEGAFIAAETEPLAGLWEVNREVVLKASRKEPLKEATIDQDATVVQSHKEQSQMTYLGERGYQPVINYWAEQDLILSDEFRDGNVPAGMNCLSSFLRAACCLPQSVETIYFRSDSAAYQHKLLDVLREGVELHGKKVPVYFAISADVSEALRGKIISVSEPVWKPLRKLTGKGLIEGRKEWAEVEFIPSAASVKRDMKPDRYLAIRVRPWQGELFSDGNSYHYYAVVTNRWEMEGEELVRWQRERCGSVEKVHDVVKNDLAGGVMPCGRFYANAAWWRLNCLCYNVISVMKRKALPKIFWPARMKALRFHLIGVAAKVVSHARVMFLKVTEGLISYREARSQLVVFSSA
ncbi:MAG TPA: IS1380 family transposase [Nitrososphaera sp.]|nr:IS1380 family transposase [Nitrososphaera sp.]